MTSPQGRRERDDRVVPVGYVAGMHATENAAGRHFQQSKKHKSLHPYAQGRKLQQLRGTTLIQP
jgi:hypothetical protein